MSEASKTPDLMWSKEEYASALSNCRAALTEALDRAQRAEARYKWAANELLACDYGDNRSGNVVGWIIYGWRVKNVDRLNHYDKPRIYGESIDAAIDKALASSGQGATEPSS